MFKEFKFIYYVSKIVFEKKQNVYIDELGIPKDDITTLDNKLSDIAFDIFFFGIGTDSEKIFKDDSTVSSQFYKDVRSALEYYQKEFSESNEDLKCLSTFSIYENQTKGSLKVKGLFYEFETKYYPFDGHISRLGHYYRQLFQIVRYVVIQENDFLSKEEVLEHLKILRTQMSNHEQLLLYYNGMSGIGLKWTGDDKNDNRDYFKEYQMIHNLPLPLAEIGHLPHIEYSPELRKEYDIFEWKLKDDYL
ncbi:MAG: putative phage abortive infection protein [Chitinophagaceae bacterium]